LDEEHGVSVFSSSVLKRGISSSSCKCSFSLKSLIDRLVAFDFATALLLGLRALYLAISKLIDQMHGWNSNEVGGGREGVQQSALIIVYLSRWGPDTPQALVIV